MTSFKRRSKQGKITIVNRGSSMGLIVGNKSIKKAIASGNAGGLTNAKMSKSFDAYKQGKPGLLERYGIIPNRKIQRNPYQ